MICPPHAHAQRHASESAAWIPIVTTETPGVHGPAVIGEQGCGVSTPCAAAVAEATCGLLIDLHMPKGAMFTLGCISATLAAGAPSASTLSSGATDNFEGEPPMEHERVAPLTTSLAMDQRFAVRGLRGSTVSPGAASVCAYWMLAEGAGPPASLRSAVTACGEATRA